MNEVKKIGELFQVTFPDGVEVRVSVDTNLCELVGLTPEQVALNEATSLHNRELRNKS